MSASVESIAVAKQAGLLWINDGEPGIRRKKRGRGFVYLAVTGRVISADRELRRIKSLAIPPAWTDVWICPDGRGHIQATGRDAKGRKQYRYHCDWREHRDGEKYSRLLEFGTALPALRRRVARDLAQTGIPRTKVLAAMARLLDMTLIRVGNDEYARANHSYGLTTLRDQHVTFAGAKVRFAFRGKSGVARVLELEDPLLARVVKKCQDLPGQTLFQYIAEDGSTERVTSTHLNEYLRELSGTDFTAKYFRTWGGTLSVMCRLADVPAPKTVKEQKKEELEAIRHASSVLGNTVSVCRSFYVHPAVLDAYRLGRLESKACRSSCEGKRWRAKDLSPRERALMAVLRWARTTEKRRPSLEKLLERSVRKAA